MYYFDFGIVTTALIIALVGCALVVYFMLCGKKQFTGFLAKVSDFFNYKVYWVPYFIKGISAFATIFVFVFGLGMLFKNFLIGLVIMAFGTLAIRLQTELIMLFYDMRENLNKITKKDDCCASEKTDCCSKNEIAE